MVRNLKVSRLGPTDELHPDCSTLTEQRDLDLRFNVMDAVGAHCVSVPDIRQTHSVVLKNHLLRPTVSPCRFPVLELTYEPC